MSLRYAGVTYDKPSENDERAHWIMSEFRGRRTVDRKRGRDLPNRRRVGTPLLRTSLRSSVDLATISSSRRRVLSQKRGLSSSFSVARPEVKQKKSVSWAQRYLLDCGEPFVVILRDENGRQFHAVPRDCEGVDALDHDAVYLSVLYASMKAEAASAGAILSCLVVSKPSSTRSIGSESERRFTGNGVFPRISGATRDLLHKRSCSELILVSSEGETVTRRVAGLLPEAHAPQAPWFSTLDVSRLSSSLASATQYSTASSHARIHEVPVEDWSVKDVGYWLRAEVDLPDLVDHFHHERIDGAVLLHLEDPDLRYVLGISSPIKRKKLLHAIIELRQRDIRNFGLSFGRLKEWSALLDGDRIRLIARLKEAFDAIDEDKDGRISIQDLARAFERTGVHPEAAQRTAALWLQHRKGLAGTASHSSLLQELGSGADRSQSLLQELSGGKPQHSVRFGSTSLSAELGDSAKPTLKDTLGSASQVPPPSEAKSLSSLVEGKDERAGSSLNQVLGGETKAGASLAGVLSETHQGTGPGTTSSAGLATTLRGEPKPSTPRADAPSSGLAEALGENGSSSRREQNSSGLAAALSGSRGESSLADTLLARDATANTSSGPVDPKPSSSLGSVLGASGPGSGRPAPSSGTGLYAVLSGQTTDTPASTSLSGELKGSAQQSRLSEVLERKEGQPSSLRSVLAEGGTTATSTSLSQVLGGSSASANNGTLTQVLSGGSKSELQTLVGGGGEGSSTLATLLSSGENMYLTFEEFVVAYTQAFVGPGAIAPEAVSSQAVANSAHAHYHSRPWIAGVDHLQPMPRLYGAQTYLRSSQGLSGNDYAKYLKDLELREARAESWRLRAMARAYTGEVDWSSTYTHPKGPPPPRYIPGTMYSNPITEPPRPTVSEVLQSASQTQRSLADELQGRPPPAHTPSSQDSATLAALLRSDSLLRSRSGMTPGVQGDGPRLQNYMADDYTVEFEQVTSEMGAIASELMRMFHTEQILRIADLFRSYYTAEGTDPQAQLIRTELSRRPFAIHGASLLSLCKTLGYHGETIGREIVKLVGEQMTTILNRANGSSYNEDALRETLERHAGAGVPPLRRPCLNLERVLGIISRIARTKIVNPDSEFARQKAVLSAHVLCIHMVDGWEGEPGSDPWYDGLSFRLCRQLQHKTAGYTSPTLGPAAPGAGTLQPSYPDAFPLSASGPPVALPVPSSSSTAVPLAEPTWGSGPMPAPASPPLTSNPWAFSPGLNSPPQPRTPSSTSKFGSSANVESALERYFESVLIKMLDRKADTITTGQQQLFLPYETTENRRAMGATASLGPWGLVPATTAPLATEVPPGIMPRQIPHSHSFHRFGDARAFDSSPASNTFASELPSLSGLSPTPRPSHNRHNRHSVSFSQPLVTPNSRPKSAPVFQGSPKRKPNLSLDLSSPSFSTAAEPEAAGTPRRDAFARSPSLRNVLGSVSPAHSPSRQSAPAGTPRQPHSLAKDLRDVEMSTSRTHASETKSLSALV